MNWIPDEVIYEIASHLEFPELKTFSLVSRRIHAIAVPLIYRNIIFADFSNLEQILEKYSVYVRRLCIIPFTSDFVKFGDALKRFSLACPNLKALELRTPDFRHPFYLGSTAGNPYAQHVFDLVRLLSKRLETLETRLGVGLFEEGVCFPKLQAALIHCSWADIPRILESHPNIEAISIQLSDRDNGGQQVALPDKLPFRRLLVDRYCHHSEPGAVAQLIRRCPQLEELRICCFTQAVEAIELLAPQLRVLSVPVTRVVSHPHPSPPHLLHALPNWPRLTSLTLHGDSFSSSILYKFVSTCSTLRELSMEFRIAEEYEQEKISSQEGFWAALSHPNMRSLRSLRMNCSHVPCNLAPLSCTRLRHLEWLYLEDHHLDAFGTLTQLVHLNLSFSRLQCLPAGLLDFLEQNRGLRKLILRMGNWIRDYEVEQVVLRCPLLEYIDLGYTIVSENCVNRLRERRPWLQLRKLTLPIF
ncbi:uncharacterized protein VTP21DRAFT_7535 [Calcarisporiella thermophila]|uniref:uncharacterized protein n=1 Tax=Calcarisporiella thermophila TaxID=911321 RepID=UPI003742FEB2